jgi:competence protein ComEC
VEHWSRPARDAVSAGGWRLAAVAGLAAGLGASPFWSAGGLPEAVLALACLLVVFVRRGRLGPGAAALVLCVAALVGLGIGDARLRAIDGSALRVAPRTEVRLVGSTLTAPRNSRGVNRFVLGSDRGKVMVEALDVPVGLSPGDGVAVTGKVVPGADWYRPNLERQGLSMLVRAVSVERSGPDRGGIAGALGSARGRAEEALSSGMPPREGALARGFVLGQDQDIDPQTVTSFRDSGLAHLLAVSGQNVVLLCLLALPILTLAGLGRRGRLVGLTLLILAYIPLAGGGPSIQRAGVMGLAGLVALAAARPVSRLYVIALAAAVTLAINPRAGADAGWQLSFAAVIGIGLLAAPIACRLTGAFGSLRPGPGRLLADAAAVTIAATVSTAPLTAFHFERLPVASLPANLLAMPAVAPSMWLGMLSAAVGQAWTGLAVPLNLVNSVLLAYIAQVASWFGDPSWAVLEVRIGSFAGLLVAYGALGVSVAACLHMTRRFLDGPPALPPLERRSRNRHRAVAGVLVAAGLAALIWHLPGSGRRELAEPPPGGARIEILDIGQGDATLIRPHGTDPVLVDGGPPGGGVVDALDSAGVQRLEAVVATHADLDHIGGLYDVFDQFEVGRYLFDGSPKDLLSQARSAGVARRMVAEGQEMRLGPLSLEVLWPPARGADFIPPADRNDRSVVLLVSLHGYRVLLTGDAEAEAVPLSPGHVEVLKVAHHGSDDAGLAALLEGTSPELALISAGRDNPYGHPTAETMATLEAAVPETLTTAREGTISLVFAPDGVSIETGR